MTTDDLVYLLTHQPTIAEVRALNREGLMDFPLPMLLALTDAGVNVETEQDATIEQFVHIGECVEIRWSCWLAGKRIAILGGEGIDGFRALTKRRYGTED